MKQNFSKKENQEFIRYNNYINQIFSSKIIFSNHIGWDYIIKGNDIFCLINSGYYNNDKNIFSFHRTKETNNYIILPLLFHHMNFISHTLYQNYWYYSAVIF